jgi:hypothetical protein
MKHRSEALSIYKNFFAMIRTHFDTSIRVFCTDSAEKYCCRSKPTGEQCLNNTRSREAHVAADGAP